MNFKINQKHYILVILVFLGSFNFSYAKVIISEVSISPTEKRFIELYNSSSSAVSLTGYYIQRKNESAEEFASLVSKTYFEGVSISGGGYLVITRSSDSYTDILVPSLTLTPSNTIQLKNPAKEIIDTLSWGDVGEGESINKNVNGSKSIKSISPSSGISDYSLEEENESEEDIPNNNDEDDSNSENENENETILRVNTKIISPKVVFSGIPFDINGETTTNNGNVYGVGNFVWNFGDGMSLKKNKAEPFRYVYDYPGEYVVTLSYFDTVFSQLPEATDKITIKVLPASLGISSIGNFSDPYVEIENKSSHEISLDGWVISSINNNFYIPSGTIILPGKKIKFSPKITNFRYEDLAYLKITDPNKNIVSSYPTVAKSVVSKNLGTVKTENIKSGDDVNLNNVNSIDNYPNEKNVINLNSLEASVNKSESNINPLVLSILGLIGIIVIAFLVLVSLRKEKNKTDEIEDEINEKDFILLE